MPDGVRRRDQRQTGRRGHRGAGALHRARDDERDAVGGQPAHQRRDREHPDAGQERSLVPDRVTDAAAEQQQPAEGQHVGGDHPALGGVGQVQVGLHTRQRDDDDGAVERRHQLHAGDRDDRDAEHVGRQRRGGPAVDRRRPTRRRHGLPAYPDDGFGEESSRKSVASSRTNRFHLCEEPVRGRGPGVSTAARHRPGSRRA